jgi:hypothetical protein
VRVADSAKKDTCTPVYCRATGPVDQLSTQAFAEGCARLLPTRFASVRMVSVTDCASNQAELDKNRVKSETHLFPLMSPQYAKNSTCVA